MHVPLSYSPALAGLRAIAVLLVMAFHADVPWLPGANLGVDIFFVLSGYLVGRLLLAEYVQTGSLALRAFYKRRLWRLMPALLLLVGLYLAGAFYVWPDYYFHVRDAFGLVLYVADIALITGHGPQYLLHAWSLAIEERFYLLLPWLMLGIIALFGKRHLVLSLAVLILMLWGWEAFWFSDYETGFYYRFDLRISGLFIGVLLAFLGPVRFALQGRARQWLALCIAVVWLYLVLAPSTQAWRLGFGGGVLEASCLLAIAWCVSQPDNPLAQLLAHRWLVYVGNISYGLYLFHYPLMMYLKTQLSWPWVWFLGMLGALILAVLSWHWLESPINNWRRQRY